MDDALVFPLLRVPFQSLGEVDLSAKRGLTLGKELWRNEELKDLLENDLAESGAWVLYGGYLEQRSIYGGVDAFLDGSEPREFHLGIDFWCSPETAVYTPWDSIVHSVQDNPGFHDYGATLILEHWVQGGRIYSLYGHLSHASLKLFHPGDKVAAGQLIGWVGAPHENGQWPPHLHFQLIHDLEGQTGDYPGVCAASKLDFYRHNCPDPRPMLGL